VRWSRQMDRKREAFSSRKGKREEARSGDDRKESASCIRGSCCIRQKRKSRELPTCALKGENFVFTPCQRTSQKRVPPAAREQTSRGILERKLKRSGEKRSWHISKKKGERSQGGEKEKEALGAIKEEPPPAVGKREASEK